MKRTTFLIAFILALLSSFKLYSQTTYYSNATATDFNNVSSWGTAADGTGTAPASISNADNFVIANSAALTLSANATVRQLTINSGSLSVASNTLTVSKAGAFDSSFVVNNGGTLNLSASGTLEVNGNVLFANGSSYLQSGGNFNVDGNNGGSATGSVASGTPIFAIGTSSSSYSTGNISLTGGTLTIVDPHTATTTTGGYAFYVYFPSGYNVEAGSGHTTRFGNGISTDAGGNANGFYADPYVSSGRINLGTVVVNALVGTNRHVYNPYAYGIHGNLDIISGELRANAGLILRGNLNVTGTGVLTTLGTLNLAIPSGTSSVINTVAQSLSVAATATLRNNATTPTANIYSLTINNSSTGGVTFDGTSTIATNPANSLSVGSTLTFTAGRLAPASNAVFVLGNASPSAGTLSYTSGGFASGTTFGRWSTATGTGTSFTAGTDATSATSRYPFVNASGQDRSAWIERVSPASAAGILGVTYTNTSGSTAVNATDTSVTPNFTVDLKANDGWQVTNVSGTPLAATSFKLQLQAPGAFVAQQLTANTRIIQGTSFVGTHQAGTVTPGGQRIGLTGAELTAAPFTLAISSADFPVMTVASGDWNNPAIWSTGVVPTCTDGVNILAGHTVTVNATGNVTKTLIINSGATLNIASGDLLVGCTLNNATLTNNGTLNITGGTLTLNGNFNMNNGANLSQTGGNFVIDGNDNGATATSVASGTPLFRIGNSTTAYATGTVSLTGGTITIVDPHTATTNTSAYAVYTYFPSGFNVEAGAGHTFQFGDGVSTQAGGNTSGFYINIYPGSGKLNMGNIVVNNPSGTNRDVVTLYQQGVHGNVSVLAGDFRPSSLLLEGNLSVTGGSYTSNGGLTLAAPSGTGSVAGTSAQTLSYTAPGVVRNATSSETANFTSLTVNNTNATGVTLNNPFSLSGTLTLTAGKVNTTSANLLTVGTATAAGSISGASATSYVNGPIARTIATGNAATNFIQFPVGKAAYAPVWIAPTTTAVSVFKAEAFDANTGTMDASVINLATGRRWEAPLVSGTYTDIKVRLGDAAIASTNIPVLAPAADGAYSSLFGSVATYAAGTPNTTQANNAVTAANYTGFISYADSNLCSGTPAPGNTVASSTVICSGTSVTLSVQNTTVGSGVTYQWQSSADGIAYADISGATSATYVTTPAASLYYRLNVTCSAGPVTGTSVPVQVTFSNSVATTTAASRCGTGSVTLQATPSTGATTRWYAAATGGASIAEGNSFTTPSISATTTYYAAAETGGATLAGGKLTPESTWDGYVTTDWGIVFNALQDVAVNSVDVYSTSAGTIKVKIVNASGTELFASATVNVAAGGTTTPTTVPLDFTVPAGTGYRIVVKEYSGISLIRGGTNVSFPYTNANISVTSSYYGSVTTGTYYFFYNIITSSSCGSARVPVVATVNPAPALTVSGNPAAICAGESTAAAVTLTAGAADYDTFTWTPAAGVTGNATTGWTFNPTVSTVYTLNASSSTGTMCVANAATVNVTVNALPTAIVAPATVAVCENGVGQISATGGLVPSVVFQDNFDVLSAQFSTATVSGTPAAAANTTYYAQGAGSVLFNTTSQSADVSYGVNSNINLTPYASAQLTFSHIAGMEGTTYSYDIGYVQYSTDGGANWSTFPTSSYAGNGTLVTTQGTSTAVTGVIFSGKSYTDWNAQFTGAASTPGTAPAASLWKTETINIPAAALTSQFRIRFRYTTDSSALYYGWLIDNVKITGQQSQIVWSPATNLYTDAAATQAYVAGTVAPTVYVAPTAAATYTATATNSVTGCNITATVNVTVTSTPAPTASAQTFCGATTVSQLQATGTTIQWYSTATGGSALAGTAAVTTGTYYASQTLNGCESITRTPVAVTVNVTAAPTAAAQTFCNAATVADLVATGTTIQWYAAATGGTALSANDALATGTYYVSQTLNGCESARTAVAVTVNVTPAPTAVAQTFCNAAAVADLVATGTAVQWYAAATGGTALSANDALATGTYYASQTLNGCESARTAVAVTVNVTAAPTAVAQTFCNAAAVADLEATGTAVQWYAAATGGVTLNENDALATGTYYASQTIDGCESTTRVAVSVTVNVTPAVEGATTQEIAVAQGEDATIEDIVVTAQGTVTWYASLEDAQQGLNALADGTVLVNNTTYYAMQTVNGCTSADVLAVTVTVSLGRDDFNVSAFGYYPNPVKDVITITYNKEITAVTVVNLLGQEVVRVMPNATEAKVDMSALAEGTYILTVQSGNAAKTVKVIKAGR
jgi:Ig-like domain CHU_C associated/Secretion system C-terminal sorting domain